MRVLFVVLSLVFSLLVVADESTPAKYYIMPSEHNAQELLMIFERADQLQLANQNTLNPVVLVLFGEELRLFNRKHYREQKEIVDYAARLSALGAVELRASQHEMAFMHLEPEDIPAFFIMVEDLTQEQQRLEQAGYQVLTFADDNEPVQAE